MVYNSSVTSVERNAARGEIKTSLRRLSSRMLRVEQVDATLGFKITENTEFTQKLKQTLFSQFQEYRGGIHVSDLTYCVRQAYYRRIDPRPINETALGYYVAGRGHHGVIQDLCKPFNIEKEQKIKKLGVTGTVDLLEGKRPIEIKTTRSRKLEIASHYLKQLGYYCVLKDYPYGTLVIFHLLPTPETGIFRTYDVDISSRFNVVQDELIFLVGTLKYALEHHDPSRCPRTGLTWKCDSCDYRIPCWASKP